LEFNVPFQHKYGYIRDDKIGGKLVLITNRKSDMRFRLMPNRGP